MKTVVYVPEICRGAESKFEGKLVLRVPTIFEKLELSDKFEALKKAEVSASRQTIEMLKATQDYYSEVYLKNKETGEELKSFDDMTTEPLLEMTLVEIATKVLTGVKPGES